MSYELTGKLIAKTATEQKSQSFRKREFVVEKTDEANGKTFVNYAKFQCVQEKTDLLDRVNVGDNVKVYFNIRGTKWERDGNISYITNLDAWKIDQLLGNAARPQAEPFSEPLDSFTDAGPADDLPF